MMCLLAAGLAQVGSIELLDGGVLMGLADRLSCIFIIEHLGAKRADIHGVAHTAWLLGLSAAVYTAARTSHDFDEVVVSFAGFHFFKQFLCIAKAGSNGNLWIGRASCRERV